MILLISRQQVDDNSFYYVAIRQLELPICQLKFASNRIMHIDRHWIAQLSGNSKKRSS